MFWSLFSLALLFSLSLITFYFKGASFLLDPFSKCSAESLVYTSEEDPSFFTKVTLYKKKRLLSSKKAIFLIPPTGGKNIIDEGYAYMFCKRNFDVLILESGSGEKGVEKFVKDFNVHERASTRAFKSILLALDNMDYESIGALGTSAGAINFSMALSNEYVASKVNTFFNIVGGAPLCDVIARAGEEGLLKVRAKRFKEFGFKNMKEYSQKICSVVNSRIPLNKPKELKFGMILAKKDQTVPYDLQENQANLWEPELKFEINSNHLNTVIKSYLFKRKKILKFFTQQHPKD